MLVNLRTDGHYSTLTESLEEIYQHENCNVCSSPDKILDRIILGSICHGCSKDFGDSESLEKHYNETLCDLCFKNGLHDEEMEQHKNIHHKCFVCQEFFKERDQHIMQEHKKCP